MKILYKFDYIKDRENLEIFDKALDMAAAFDEIEQRVFRPARKHGYSDIRLRDLSERDLEVISIIEDLYFDIKRERGLT